MKRILWPIIALLFIFSGCAGGGYYGYQGDYPPTAYGQQYDSIHNPVPPSWYGNDPSMRQWYTFPYYNPELQ